ncbi:MAG: signal peptidase II [Candidatus Azotimanducaceae bacterium]|jgi:signal peptidase II
MIHVALVVLLIGLDQWSKWYMSDLLTLCVPGRCESIVILPVFQLTLLHNSGAAFSFLDDAGGWQRWFLVSISVLVSAYISVWLYRIRQQEKLLAFGLALILGGALGNLIDRAFVGYVVDFLVVHWDDAYFPAFNVADSAITVGAGVLILEMFLKKDPDKTVESTNG